MKQYQFVFNNFKIQFYKDKSLSRHQRIYFQEDFFSLLLSQFTNRQLQKEAQSLWITHST